MKGINRHDLEIFSTWIRDQYPDAVLGFLGNSLSVPALYDRYCSLSETKREQYLIPFSDHVVECTNLFDAYETGSYIYRISTDMSCPLIQNYIQTIKQSPISPLSLMQQNKKLVILDRIVAAEGLVSFGYLWRIAAVEQGLSAEKIEQNIELCGFANVPIKYENYTINDKNRQKIYSEDFVKTNMLSYDLINEVIYPDDRMRLRFVPEMSIAGRSKPQTTSPDHYKKMGMIFESIMDVSQSKISLDIDFPIQKSTHKKALQKLAGLIIE